MTFLFHGGEPLLAGIDRFDAWCNEAKAVLGADRISFAVQTNGTLIDDRWSALFHRHGFSVGISLDGPPDVNDQNRVDVHHRGSYKRVLDGIERLRSEGVSWAILSVVNLDHDPLTIHRHLINEVGATNIDYLIPDQTHETIKWIRSRYGPTPLADWLIPIFDEWWRKDSIRIRVRSFDKMIASVLPNKSPGDQIDSQALGYLVVETDGSIEGLDVLKICKPGLTETGLTVRSQEPVELALPSFHRETVFGGMPLPQGCHGCPEAQTCAGGYLPHRYSLDRDFDNPSAWCADLLKLFSHVRSRLYHPRAELPSAPAANQRLLH
jgi:uncharacterized protein